MKLRSIALLILCTLLCVFSCESQKPPDPLANEELVTALPPLSVRFFDVGQGDSILIECDGAFMLIDSGPATAAFPLLNDLDDCGVKTLAYCVFTHPHEDHIGCGTSVLQRYKPELVLMPDVVHTTRTYEALLDTLLDLNLPVQEPTVGAQFSLGGAVFEILAPQGESYRELNNYSIVLRLTYGKTSFLFTGDAQDLSEYEMLEHPETLKADVLKVGHHGSHSSTTREFLEAVNPAIAVISVGASNSYGHPSQTTLFALSEHGTQVYRTDKNGTITIQSDGTALTMLTQK